MSVQLIESHEYTPIFNSLTRPIKHVIFSAICCGCDITNDMAKDDIAFLTTGQLVDNSICQIENMIDPENDSFTVPQVLSDAITEYIKQHIKFTL